MSAEEGTSPAAADLHAEAEQEHHEQGDTETPRGMGGTEDGDFRHQDSLGGESGFGGVEENKEEAEEEKEAEAGGDKTMMAEAEGENGIAHPNGTEKEGEGGEMGTAETEAPAAPPAPPEGAPPAKRPFKFFVGGLSGEVNQEDVRKYFSEEFGGVKEVQLIMDYQAQPPRNRGFGFVTLEDDSKRKEIFGRSHTLNGRKFEVEEEKKKEISLTESTTKKLFVGGIKEVHTEESLKELFSQFGTVDEVAILREHTGQLRGYGFVTFAEIEHCRACLRHIVDVGGDGLKLEGVTLEVRAAEPRRTREPRDFPPRGGRGGFGPPGGFGDRFDRDRFDGPRRFDRDRDGRFEGRGGGYGGGGYGRGGYGGPPGGYGGGGYGGGPP
eukprot:Cvel_28553.t1-p1 / transcript=Cvel_28553.t1 / gene=Cvel_28553 / organism=Chromera_velia_CCMP2878 / gene_product=RNA-binding protein Musashi homolog 1, putative / transcript_product=RNA-binding protein Musashi homolog 1, putative / location=Cvel_scaffold3760:44-4903(-) / protein_length=381 / sequence_SO=supercontig / SO=protein_coding / is_pseudo=false